MDRETNAFPDPSSPRPDEKDEDLTHQAGEAAQDQVGVQTRSFRVDVFFICVLQQCFLLFVYVQTELSQSLTAEAKDIKWDEPWIEAGSPRWWHADPWCKPSLLYSCCFRGHVWMIQLYLDNGGDANAFVAAGPQGSEYCDGGIYFDGNAFFAAGPEYCDGGVSLGEYVVPLLHVAAGARPFEWPFELDSHEDVHELDSHGDVHDPRPKGPGFGDRLATMDLLLQRGANVNSVHADESGVPETIYVRLDKWADDLAGPWFRDEDKTEYFDLMTPRYSGVLLANAFRTRVLLRLWGAIVPVRAKMKVRHHSSKVIRRRLGYEQGTHSEDVKQYCEAEDAAVTYFTDFKAASCPETKSWLFVMVEGTSQCVGHPKLLRDHTPLPEDLITLVMLYNGKPIWWEDINASHDGSQWL